MRRSGPCCCLCPRPNVSTTNPSTRRRGGSHSPTWPRRGQRPRLRWGRVQLAAGPAASRSGRGLLWHVSVCVSRTTAPRAYVISSRATRRPVLVAVATLTSRRRCKRICKGGHMGVVTRAQLTAPRSAVEEQVGVPGAVSAGAVRPYSAPWAVTPTVRGLVPPAPRLVPCRSPATWEAVQPPRGRLDRDMSGGRRSRQPPPLLSAR